MSMAQFQRRESHSKHKAAQIFEFWDIVTTLGAADARLQSILIDGIDCTRTSIFLSSIQKLHCNKLLIWIFCSHSTNVLKKLKSFKFKNIYSYIFPWDIPEFYWVAVKNF
jgi:hypothetical protein